MRNFGLFLGQRVWAVYISYIHHTILVVQCQLSRQSCSGEIEEGPVKTGPPPPQLCTGIHKHFKDPFRFDDSAVRMSVSIDIHKQLVNPNGSDDSAVRMSVSTGIHKHAMDP